jgi:DNA phosphorothioation-dependent restriction protein DptG
MNDNKFSEDLPIKDLMKSYLGIDINGKSLDAILNKLAEIIDAESAKLRPTTGPLAYQRMKTKFNYLIVELCDLYSMNDIDTKGKLKSFWDLVGELRKERLGN